MKEVGFKPGVKEMGVTDEQSGDTKHHISGKI